MTKCLRLDPMNRATAEEVLKGDIVNNVESPHLDRPRDRHDENGSGLRPQIPPFPYPSWAVVGQDFRGFRD